MYKASQQCHKSTLKCLQEVPTLESLVQMLVAHYCASFVIKVSIDADDVFQDVVSFYKSPQADVSKRLRFRVHGAPVIDAGGVRRQVFTTIFSEFATNKVLPLFEGPPHSLHPALTRSCGLFKVLGQMIGHSIDQDGIGFPYLSQASYRYMVSGEEAAVEHASLADVGADVAAAITMVCVRFQ